MKKIYIFIVLLLLTGCTVNYDLEIKDNEMIENIKGEISKNEFDPITDENGDHLIYSLLYDEQTAILDKIDFYSKELIEERDKITFKYKYNYNNDNDFSKSRILNECYENVIYKETDGFYIIKLYGEFYCLFSDKINVNVTTNYHVLDHNANKVNGNTYSFVLKKDSTDIEMKISKIEKEEISSAKRINYFRLIGFIVFAILCVVAYILYRKKNNDK